MSDLVLFWHRRDLRLSDSVGIRAARDRSPKVIGIFCLDPQLLQPAEVAPARVTYLIGCLQKLQDAYAQAGSQLLILKDNPRQGLPRLVMALNAQAVYWHKDVEPYSRTRDRDVAATLRSQNIEVCATWDQLLHAPAEIHTGKGDPYSVYTPFWRNWSQKAKPAPLPGLMDAIGLTDNEQQAALKAGVISLPSPQDLGFDWQNPLAIPPGTTAAQECLEEFVAGPIFTYQDQRNFLGKPGTSGLSAALKFGVIGIRTLWQATLSALAACRSDEARASVETWQKELAWREFYQHALFAFPELATGPYRKLWQDFPWEGTDQQFQAWCAGQTGYPIVDAAMRQMNQTGWMHNRARMIVASFLTKDLIIDWQRGERYFMQTLIDGDLAANNGGWQWSASSGMDPKPLRIFNPASQAQKYDPEADYIRQWLPELRGVETEALVTGNISPGDREHCGYPDPIVDHKQQQQRFKQLYQQQKAKTAS
ncbi:deoxyribodipyrimidine photolyase [Synechococcales cyanobacterium C]|uniref:Deoxyribodipyrimidine photolyase n=1 Tax=Petrachloros mirabilis ULC683 TaxID=2781853 RepID=A0A8K2A002_9CYAN|nr:FAD-binding domain-containing protein [Petrachloros mirabilis]NCJ07213.1 deoxyribodipyrimidine photolyase [Petrachloros mirabilis ULC683]